MKILYLCLSLMIFSSCSIFEDEVFENTDNNLMSEEDIIKEKSPPFSFLRPYNLLKERRLKSQMNIINLLQSLLATLLGLVIHLL